MSLHFHNKRLAIAGRSNLGFPVASFIQRGIGANNHCVLLLSINKFRQGIDLQFFLLKLGQLWLGGFFGREDTNLQRVSPQLAERGIGCGR